MDRELARYALDLAVRRGAEYCDVRIVATTHQNIEVKNGKLENVNDSYNIGIGIRVLVNGAWGFAGNSDMKKTKVGIAVERAFDIARASAMVCPKPIILSPRPAVRAQWDTPFEIDPFQVSLEDKLSILFAADREMREVEGVKVSTASMDIYRQEKFFVNSEGSEIFQTITQTGGGISSTAVGNGEVQTRSYPSSFRGQYSSTGYELINRIDLVGNARRTAEESVQLLTAKQCESGRRTLILGESQLALQIHESCGHPTELDRVFGMEANFAGTSFMTTDLLGNLKYGSDIVNIVSDATCPGGLGTYGFDDEGIPGQKVHIIKDGIFVGYQTSRETARILGQQSNGTMRAQSWNDIPLIRMANINLLPGDSELEEMIATTEDGLLLTTNRSWSIDDKRLNFQFGTEIGWEIKNGKLGAMVKNPTYGGRTPEFWNSCDAIANEKHYGLWGTPNCGKGQPMQVMRVGHGCSYARFNNVKVGVGYAG
ncbi:MAG: peptidase C69 [Candidatus Wallbacteria bacterium HGW-Wallbacteria-1]|jgi:TldD protein|uniref:Peptidase C69 n=1 Tax=Candidatus Wallbacteria bacterium HGW-Wallbacteria-1 TaxID=2013854 RepID=A0A2N1PN40_9BACT|nr:MAG: peptidase C69 [Candidatus Wallbacteria bacterium HGW-Wallbacteria-1]